MAKISKWRANSIVQSRPSVIVEARTAREAVTKAAVLDRPELLHVKSVSAPDESSLDRGKAFQVYFRSKDRGTPESWERAYDFVFLYFVTPVEENPSLLLHARALRLAMGQT